MKLKTLNQLGTCGFFKDWLKLFARLDAYMVFLLHKSKLEFILGSSSATFSILASQENSSTFFESDARD